MSRNSLCNMSTRKSAAWGSCLEWISLAGSFLMSSPQNRTASRADWRGKDCNLVGDTLGDDQESGDTWNQNTRHKVRYKNQVRFLSLLPESCVWNTFLMLYLHNRTNKRPGLLLMEFMFLHKYASRWTFVFLRDEELLRAVLWLSGDMSLLSHQAGFWP